ncbi:hypothetical protein [Pseudomonas sp. NBRC 111120]|uniref:hypothetical protein n=1 Tax=Pseudomonas sp. NBRC 111120 TaxID=1661035 RepID=UPI0008637793|nr:hypothetical protein [Pseudomonas sp. NBRC 111120]
MRVISNTEIAMFVLLLISNLLTWSAVQQRDRAQFWEWVQEARGDALAKELGRLQETLQCEVPE